MSKIKAGTTSTTAYQVEADTTGTLVLQTGATPTTAVYIDASQNVGIGTSSPSHPIDVVGVASDAVGIRVRGRSADNVGSVRFSSNDGATLYSAIRSASDELRLITVTAIPMSFYTSNTERMRIDSSGNVLVTSAAGLGYGTGSGGTVTQATSKSTAVTLNKPTGKITMNNAALAAGANVVFAVNNSLCSENDVVIVTPTGSANYSVEPLFAGSGQFGIRVTNRSGGSLSDALQINFALIKSATA